MDTLTLLTLIGVISALAAIWLIYPSHSHPNARLHTVVQREQPDEIDDECDNADESAGRRRRRRSVPGRLSTILSDQEDSADSDVDTIDCKNIICPSKPYTDKTFVILVHLLFTETNMNEAMTWTPSAKNSEYVKLMRKIKDTPRIGKFLCSGSFPSESFRNRIRLDIVESIINYWIRSKIIDSNTLPNDMTNMIASFYPIQARFRSLHSLMNVIRVLERCNGLPHRVRL